MDTTDKPASTSDLLCPFFRKPMRKVCHRCAYWEPLPVQQFEMGKPVGSGFVEWGCSIKNQTLTLRSILASLDGVQKATESFRNTAWTDSQRNLEALITIVASAERTIARAEKTIDALPSGVDAKLIEGKN